MIICILKKYHVKDSKLVLSITLQKNIVFDIFIFLYFQINTNMKKVLDKEMRRQRRKRKADSPNRSPVYRQDSNM